MRLSEAMRLGAMLHPQGFGTLICGVDTRGDRSTVRQTCALGAAWVASGGGMHEEIVTASFANPRGFATAGHTILILEFPAAWRELLDVAAHCPEFRCHGKAITLGAAIQHLNDDHRWTREQIADFVEPFEALPNESALARVTEQVEGERDAVI
jgi:hypothetical protein